MTSTTPRVPGRPPGPTAKGATTRSHIIDSVATVFAEMGYDRARMSDLVAATGMTKGAVYFHFDGKEALAVAVLEAKQAVWLSQVEQRIADAVPGGQRLAALVPAMLELHRRDPSTWAIAKLTANLSEVPATRPQAALFTRRWVELIAGLIRDAQRLGDCAASIDPVAAATVLVGAFDGLKAVHDILGGDGGQTAAFDAAAAMLNAMALGYLHRGAE